MFLASGIIRVDDQRPFIASRRLRQCKFLVFVMIVDHDKERRFMTTLPDACRLGASVQEHPEAP